MTAWWSRGQDFRFFFKETNNFKSTSGWFSRGRSERKRSKLWASSSRAGIFCFTLFFVTIGPFYSLRQTVTHVAPPSRTRLVVSTKKEKMRTHARSKGPLIEHYITMRSPIVCCACTLVGTTPREVDDEPERAHRLFTFCSRFRIKRERRRRLVLQTAHSFHPRHVVRRR